MNVEMVMFLAKKSVLTSIYVAGPLLGLGVAVGVLISLFQTITSIREQTLTFAPKFFVVLVGLVLLAPFMLNHLIGFTQYIFSHLYMFAR